MDLKGMIRTVPDFPRKGIMFRDITTLLLDGAALDESATLLAERFRPKRPEIVFGVESRGFIIGAAVALKLGIGFAPVRKKGKLPAKTIRARYALEYGTDCIEMHADAVKRGQRVLLIDDLLATGGTAKAAARLVERAGGRVVGCGFLIELSFLKGAQKLKKYGVYSLIRYESE